VGAFSTQCVKDAPFVVIQFGNQPQYNGMPATVTFHLLTGQVIEVTTVTYQANSTVRLIYPGATIDPVTGAGTDWPGWKQLPDGSWVTDPSDQAFRDGLVVTVEVNPSATGTISYPPETSTCANPPMTPATTAPPASGETPTTAELTSIPVTGSESTQMLFAALAALCLGAFVILAVRRPETA
jgi:hypothetical protein